MAEQTLQDLLAILKGVSEMCSWKSDNGQKALWLDMILAKYRDFSKANNQAK